MITTSSLPLSHPAYCHPISGDDGIPYYTRRLNCNSILHTGIFWFETFVSLRQLLYCIVWAYSLAAWLEINIVLTYLLTKKKHLSKEAFRMIRYK